MSDTFTRTNNLNGQAAFGRDSTALGTAGVEGPATYGGVLGSRTLDGPIQQPASAAEAGVKFNQVMATLSENYEPFIQKRTISRPSFWHDRIARGAYTLFSGINKQTKVFRGGLAHYAGLAHWDDVVDWTITPTSGTGATGSINGQTWPKTHPDPVTYGYSWEAMAWGGKNMAWASDPIHQDMFRFTHDAATQLEWILEAGVEFGISQQEVWNRDNMIFAAVQNGRAYIMGRNGEDATSTEQFYYNPYAYGTAAEVAAGTKLSTVPFVLWPFDTEVESLNFDMLDNLNDELAIMAPDGGVAMQDNRPVFGLPASTRDVEKWIKGNERELLNWREARAEELITGYGMMLRTYRYYAMVEDANQLRFNFTKIVTAAEAHAAGIDAYGSSANTKLALAEYVPPRKLGRIGANGIGIPVANMDYIKADLAIIPMFLNDVMVNQFVPDTPQLGSGTTFLPRTGLNGKWGWQNIIDKTTNPFGKTGNFYGLIEIFAKPGGNFTNMTACLYRRATESLRSRVPQDLDPQALETTELISTDVTDAVAGEEILHTMITVSLSRPLKNATVGSPCTVACLDDSGASKTVIGIIVQVHAAPTYGVAITSLNSVEGSGTGGVTYFTDANFPAGGDLVLT